MHGLGTKVFQKILDTLPNNIYVKDTKGRYVWLNRSCIRLLAAQHLVNESIIGKTDFDIFPEQHAIEYAKNDKIVMENRQGSVVEENVVLPSGEHLMQLSFKEPLIDDTTSELLGIVGYTIDITDKKQKEEAVIKSKNAAEIANRAKTEFLANMSHDVKTPMTGVVNVAELMTQNPSWRTPEKAEMIRSCGLQILNFFNNCLELSKLEMAEWSSIEEVFSLQTLLEEIRILFAPQALSKGLEFNIEYDERLPKVLVGHRGSIYRVILNLVGNALKFTEKGEVHIRVFLEEMISENNIHIGIEVKDTGIGIPKDKHSIIFEKLRRLTPSYEGKIEGSGIGLYIVDQYVKHLDGSITVESDLGKGSKFTVILPVIIPHPAVIETTKNYEQAPKKNFMPEKTPETTVTPALIEPNIKEKAHILLVEDNLLIQHISQSLLNSIGFSVDIASTGQEALTKFSSGKYALVYMDIGLPDIDGYAVTREIRKIDALIPIVALTAHGALDVQHDCEEAGMQEVISKPLTRERAESVWEKYKPSNASTSIINFAEMIQLLGSENKAKEMLALWKQELTQHYLPTLKLLVQQKNYAALTHELHSMIGGLCYVKMPQLHEAVLTLQEAIHATNNEKIDTAYQLVLQKAEQVLQTLNAKQK